MLTSKEGTALTQPEGNRISQSAHVDNHTAGALTSTDKALMVSSAGVASLSTAIVAIPGIMVRASHSSSWVNAFSLAGTDCAPYPATSVHPDTHSSWRLLHVPSSMQPNSDAPAGLMQV